MCKYVNLTSYFVIKQAEKLKSREMKEGWMKNDEGWMKNDEGWKMNDEGWWFQAVEGFCFKTDRRTNERTDICDCRVAFATENYLKKMCYWGIVPYSEQINRSDPCSVVFSQLSSFTAQLLSFYVISQKMIWTLSFNSLLMFEISMLQIGVCLPKLIVDDLVYF